MTFEELEKKVQHLPGTLATLHILEAAATTMVERSMKYGDAFLNDGAAGVFYGVSRKFHRLKHRFETQNVISEEDTLDLVNYAAMLQALVWTAEAKGDDDESSV